MRCKHLNCTIIEQAVTDLTFWFTDGEPAGDAAGHSAPTGKYVIECHDCKTWREVWNLPKWAKAMLEKARSA